MANWPYAEHSHWIKMNGGPEKALESFGNARYNSGYAAGLRVSLALIPVALSAGAAIYAGTTKIITTIKEKQKSSEDEANRAEVEILTGIKNIEEKQESL